MDSDISKLYNPASKEVQTTLDSISSRLMTSKKNRQKEKYLIFFLFATHGYLRDGKQFTLLNEFNKKDNFYSRIAAE